MTRRFPLPGKTLSANPPKTVGICDVCGEALSIRADDEPETIARRLTVFREQTAPLIDYYKAEGKLALVPCGDKSVEEVSALVFQILGIA